MKTALLILVPMVLASLTGCFGNKEDAAEIDIQETGQQIGDVMASIDESGGSTGSIAVRNSDEMSGAAKVFARHSPADARDAWYANLLVPTAHAATCSSASTFGSCAAHSLTRTFGGCTVGLATFRGTVVFDWTHSAPSPTCDLSLAGDYVTRTPNFTVTGRRQATLAVSAVAASAQRLTYVSGAGTSRVLQFDNGGIRRKFTIGATTLFDFTTSTNSAITITGTDRATRVVSGGSLRVTNNRTGVTCDYVPSNVAWTAGCNCPTSGSWSGTCSDGVNTSLVLTGCGTATLTLGSDSEAFTFDRCGA